MIRATLLRLVVAWGMALAGAGLMANDLDNLLGLGLLVVGFIWGTVLLFVLAGQLLVFGLSGLLHDIDTTRERDPWNRW
jgi:hypothetical protein